MQVDVSVYFLNVMYSSTLELVSEFQEKGLRVYADLLTDLESLKELPLDGDNRLLASKSRGKPTQVVYTEICRHCAEFKTIIVLMFYQWKYSQIVNINEHCPFVFFFTSLMDFIK